MPPTTPNCFSSSKIFDKSFIVMNMYIDYCRESIVARFFLDVSVLNRCTLDLNVYIFGGERGKGEEEWKKGKVV